MPRSNLSLPILLILVISFLSFSTIYTQKGNNNDNEVSFLSEYLTAIHSGSRSKINNFIRGHADSTFLEKIPFEVFTSFNLQYFYLSGGNGYDLLDIVNSGEKEVKALIKNKFTNASIELRIPVVDKNLMKINGFIEFKTIEGINKGNGIRKFHDNEIIEKLEKCLKLIVKDEEFSGTVLLAKNGKSIFQKAYGFSNKSDQIENDINTKFNIASVGKIFTGVAIAQLAEKNKLSFDDTIDKYISSDWLNPEVSKKIKIKHLLTHTSGLGDYFRKLNTQCDKLIFRNLNDYKVLVSDQTLSFEPGTKWSYSNTGMLLLGVIIEKITGIDYFDYLQKNVFNIAGMKNTGAFEKDRPVSNRAIGYIKDFTNGKTDWFENSFSRVVKGSPSGGCYSTIIDLLNFCNALNSHKLISEEYTEIVLSPKPELNSTFYGYGFFIQQNNLGKIIKHGGDGTGINAQLSCYINTGYTVVVLSNYGRPAAEIIDNLLFQILTSV